MPTAAGKSRNLSWCSFGNSAISLWRSFKKASKPASVLSAQSSVGQQLGKTRQAKKKPPGGGFVKVPERTSLEPFEASLLVGFASILVNCDSS
jgi:hypothetical protein